MIKYPDEDRLYEISDKVRKIRFTGRMIGKGSTRREGGGPRWTEITIYRTAGGSYVIQREGVSLVYHRADSSCRGGELVRNEDILENSVPCPDCRPPGIEALDDIRETSDPTGNREILLRRVLGEGVPYPDPEETDDEYHTRMSLKYDVDPAIIREIFESVERNLRESVDPDRYRRETTMSSADVADDPAKIVPILTYKGRLTTVATDAIQAASARDPKIGSIFGQVETID